MHNLAIHFIIINFDYLVPIFRIRMNIFQISCITELQTSMASVSALVNMDLQNGYTKYDSVSSHVVLLSLGNTEEAKELRERASQSFSWGASREIKGCMVL